MKACFGSSVGWKTERNKHIWNEIKEGYSFASIAKHHNITICRVGQIYHKILYRWLNYNYPYHLKDKYESEDRMFYSNFKKIVEFRKFHNFYKTEEISK